jgi:hypothetical protein
VIEFLWDFAVNLSHIIIVKGRTEVSEHIEYLSGEGGSLRSSSTVLLFNEKNQLKVNRRLGKIEMTSVDDSYSLDQIEGLL